MTAGKCSNCGVAVGGVVPNTTGTAGEVCCIRCQWRPLYVAPEAIESARANGVLGVLASPPTDPCPIELDPLTKLRLN